MTWVVALAVMAGAVVWLRESTADGRRRRPLQQAALDRPDYADTGHPRTTAIRDPDLATATTKQIQREIAAAHAMVAAGSRPTSRVGRSPPTTSTWPSTTLATSPRSSTRPSAKRGPAGRRSGRRRAGLQPLLSRRSRAR